MLAVAVPPAAALVTVGCRARSWPRQSPGAARHNNLTTRHNKAPQQGRARHHSKARQGPRALAGALLSGAGWEANRTKRATGRARPRRVSGIAPPRPGMRPDACRGGTVAQQRSEGTHGARAWDGTHAPGSDAAHRATRRNRAARTATPRTSKARQGGNQRKAAARPRAGSFSVRNSSAVDGECLMFRATRRPKHRTTASVKHNLSATAWPNGLDVGVGTWGP